MNIVVGCPVRDRAWILPRWFDHVEAACDHAGLTDVRYVFVGDPILDNATAKAIGAAAEMYERPAEIDYHPGNGEPYRRTWDADRFTQMVNLRNQLLDVVRSFEPDLFWSLDSDILAAPTSLSSGISALRDHSVWGAVGMKAYLTEVPAEGSGNSGRHSPTYATLMPQGGLMRGDSDGCFQTEVIMAAKLMLPTAYHVDYQYSPQGEDIGWSLACRKAGVKLGWDGRVTNKHVMSRDELDRVDPRVGF